jgi:hypothetical protein
MPRMKSQQTLSILMTQLGILTAKAFTAHEKMQQFMDHKGVDLGGGQVKISESVGAQFLDESQALMDEITTIIKQVRALCKTQNLPLPALISPLEGLVSKSLQYVQTTRATRFHTH